MRNLRPLQNKLHHSSMSCIQNVLDYFAKWCACLRIGWTFLPDSNTLAYYTKCLISHKCLVTHRHNLIRNFYIFFQLETTWVKHLRYSALGKAPGLTHYTVFLRNIRMVSMRQSVVPGRHLQPNLMYLSGAPLKGRLLALLTPFLFT